MDNSTTGKYAECLYPLVTSAPLKERSFFPIFLDCLYGTQNPTKSTGASG